MPSPTIARLAFASFLARRARFALTLLAVALSVALVVSISSGYASLARAVGSFVHDYVGSVDFEVQRPDDTRPAIGPDVIRRLREDPRVARLSSRVEIWATPLDADGRPLEWGRMMLFGVEEGPDVLGRPPRMDSGRFLLPGETDAIVVDRNTLESLGKQLGDVVEFGGRDGPLRLRIVGVVHKPAVMRMFFRSGYAPIGPLRAFVAPDRPGHATKLRGEFNLDVDSAAFADEWRARLAAIDANYSFELVRDSRRKLDQNLLGLRLASYLGSTVALAAAAFIILASLMTGVQEQHRQLAMLRAVGATRFQIGRLVCFEGLFVGTSGALLGIPLGVAGIYFVSWIFPDIFDDGVALDAVGMIYALVVAAAASLLASALPAWLASRARPVDAMSAVAVGRAGGLPWLAILAGIALALVDSLLIFGPVESLLVASGLSPELARETKLFGHFVVGLPCMLVGALLLAPLIVRGVEVVGRQVLPILLRLPAPLFRQQLTESPWRSAATGVALMIGLMLLITMNAQGRSALGAWKLPDKFPDVFIIPDAGHGALTIKPAEIEAIRRLPEIRADKVMPISVTAPLLGAQIFDIAGTAMPERTLFIGVDPTLAFDMMELDFRDGDEATARRMMTAGEQLLLKDGLTLHGTVVEEFDHAYKLLQIDGTTRYVGKDLVKQRSRGRYLVVTDEFRKLRGYRTGDTFPLETGLFFRSKVDFVIVGVVWSPGMDVMLNTFDLPTRVKQQTAATVFGTLDDARDVFQVRDAFLIAANLPLGVERAQVLDALRRALGREGLTVADIREVKHQITTVFGNLLRFASTVAWLAMAVATLGVGNAIVAGIRTRQWRLGILRALGLTRAELLRMLLAEALLLAFVGVVLGTAFGLLLSGNARKLYSVFIGFDAPLVVPWDLVLIGGAAIVAMGLAATLLPAAMTARREPLSLLQAGRAAG